MSTRMPALFVGHGNPMNAVSQNAYTQTWAKLGKSLPRPKAILAISAHWYVPQLAVTAMDKPRTIHDFGGFPEALYKFEYPAPGDPILARHVQKILNTSVSLDMDWGLDHGTWSVLTHFYPKANIPVIQLSLDSRGSNSFHYDLGCRLAMLRDEGILIFASGNLVHNLRQYTWGQSISKPYDWAARFQDKAIQLIRSGDHQALINYDRMGTDAHLSIPTPEHYLPFILILGAKIENESATFFNEDIDGGSISMLGVRLG